MKLILFPFKLIAYLLVVFIWAFGPARGWPRWNNMLGSFGGSSKDASRYVLIQYQDGSGAWNTLWTTNNGSNSIRSGLLSAQSRSATGRARAVDKETGAIIDIMQ